MALKFTLVRINPDGDSVKALYIDGILYKSGDEYHNDITAYLDGFIEGCLFSKLDIEIEQLDCIDEELEKEIMEYSNEVPSSLDSIDKTKLEKR